jgi:uncharacterized repeat protein (TIGR01451 family)
LTLGGTVGQPDAGGPHGGGSYTLYSGFWAIAAGGAVGAQADLGVTKSDGVTAVLPGQAVTYAIVVTNAGPSAVSGASVADAPPTALVGRLLDVHGLCGLLLSRRRQRRHRAQRSTWPPAGR